LGRKIGNSWGYYSRSHFYYLNNNGKKLLEDFQDPYNFLNILPFYINKNDKDASKAEFVKEMFSYCLNFSLHKGFARIIEFPKEIHWNEDNRPSYDNGPAIIWNDGKKEYYINGIKMPASIFSGPISIGLVNRQINSERRRILLERYGFEKYLKEVKAKLRHEDNCGKLWIVDRSKVRVNRAISNQFDLPANDRWGSSIYYTDNYTVGDANYDKYIDSFKTHKGWDETTEDIAILEMTNSSPEPDGSFRKFFERVPPNTKTAKAAVAWQFRISSRRYKPTAES
jgi:hypothetical protein